MRLDFARRALALTRRGCAELAALAQKIGRAVATLHDGGVVHGDLTTSNMLAREGDGALVCEPSRFSACTSSP